MFSPAVTTFRQMHESGCFVIPNPWDAGSARLLEHAGFRALATTSAGFAFSRARPDRVDALSCEDVLAHVRDIVRATSLPVSADFQHGYASDAEGVAANVTLCVATGVAGLSIEDATGDPSTPLFDRSAAIARVRAARQAIDASGSGALLTARCEAWLVGVPEPLRVSLDRLVAYAEAGADCLFAPGVRDPKEIAAIVRACAPKPVNVICTAPGLTVAGLTESLGVRRISVGSALARVALGAFSRAAQEIATRGTFDSFSGAMSFADLEAIFGPTR